MNTKAIGDIAEAKVLTKCIEKEWEVSIPFGDNYSYDMIVDYGCGLKKIQVKNGKIKNGSIQAVLVKSRRNADGIFEEAYKEGEVDLFAVYCPDNDKCYMVDFELCPKTVLTLRVEPIVNGRTKKIKLATDYEI